MSEGHPTPPTAREPRAAAVRFDLVAGITAAMVVLPKAMAYATVAGLPVAVGLYTAFLPMVIYALLGTSRVLSVSSTTTLAILAGTQLGIAVPDGDPARLVTAVATLTALVGVMLMLAAALRLGFRSGDAAMISGYMGSGQTFDDAIGEFAVEYSDQNRNDYRAFVKAVREGRINVIVED